jgi:cation diffusion facilitator CzcD-associated flavoprotein CzcO
VSDDTTVSEPGHVAFDPDALHAKYLKERDKRLRADGTRQYLDVSGAFEEFASDPYAKPVVPREPLTDEVDVVVVGGGLTGLMGAARLREAGVEDIRVIETGDDFGGTWYWNRYPGIRCDVESYIYIPLLEEVGTVPSEKYAVGREILEHSRGIGRKFDLYRNACFQTSVTSLSWDDDVDRWIITTDRGDEMKASFLCLATGVLHRPKLPGIPGINDFEGHQFHSSRWDYAYTGGDASGGLTGLKDKRVAVIGTGASAIQIVPHVGEDAKELYVFQRTPSSVDLRNNKPTDTEWFKNQEPGWQKRRMVNFDSILLGIPQQEDLVNDRWTDVWSKLAVWANTREEQETDADPAELMQMADYEKMEEIRARIDSVVTDHAAAETLKPWYNQFCKRPLYSDEFLQTFNRPNVHLIDTDGRGVDKITEHAVVVGDKSYEVDCIIYATGFQANVPAYESGGFDVYGRNGEDMSVKWAKGTRSLHGIYTHGFPNLFVLGGIAQASVTINFPHILGEQCIHVAKLVKRCLEQNITVVEVRQEAEESWGQIMAEKAVDRSQFERDCTPGYFNREGETDRPSLFGGAYGGGPFEYVDVCASWLDDGFERDMHVTHG